MVAVQLSFGQLVEAIKQLSASEKLKLNEFIWSDDVTIPIAHQKLVKERHEKAKANPGLLLDFETAIQELK